MSKKKYLSKNEIRDDLNPAHHNKHGVGHKAYISARQGRYYKANTVTHSEYVNNQKTLDLEPEKPANVPHSRLSPPFWQKDKWFGKQTYGKIPKKHRSKMHRYNRKKTKK